MMRVAVYIALPLLLCLCCLMRKKASSALLCGFLIFVGSMLAMNIPENIVSVYKLLPSYPVSLLTRFSEPYGFLFPAKLISMIFPDAFVLTVVFSAVFAVCVTEYIYRYCENSSFAALLFVGGGFWFMSLGEPCMFMAVIIAAFSFRYISERRFLRFAVMIILSACFRTEMLILLLLIPFYLFRPSIELMLVGALIAGICFCFGAADLLFNYMLEDVPEYLGTGVSPAVSAALGVCCLIAALMNRMLNKNREYYDTMIISLYAAAYISLLCVSDIRLLPVMLALALPSVLSLGSGLYPVFKALIRMTFRENGRRAIIASAVIGIVILGGWYAGLVIELAAETRAI